MEADILQIDVNGIAYASLFQPELAKLKVKDEQSGADLLTGAILGTINAIHSQIKQHPNALPVGLWDGRAAWRWDFVPTYKDGRKADPNSPDPAVRAKAELQRQFRLQVPVIRMMLCDLGVAQIVGPHIEADDLAGLVSFNARETTTIINLTKDTDWYQFLRPNVCWVRPSPPKSVTYDEMVDPDRGLVVDKVVFNDAYEYISCKAIAGDSSDSIPGVKDIGLATALKFRREFGSFEALWEKVDAGEYLVKGTRATSITSMEARDIYERNMEVMDIRKSRYGNLEELSILRMPPNHANFVALCEQWGFTRLPALFEEFRSNNTRTTRSWDKYLSLLEVRNAD